MISHCITSHDIISHRITSHRITSHLATSHHFAWHYLSLPDIASHHITQHLVVGDQSTCCAINPSHSFLILYNWLFPSSLFIAVTWVIITFPMTVLVFKILLSLPPFSWRLASIRAGQNYSNKMSCSPCPCSNRKPHIEVSEKSHETKPSPHDEDSMLCAIEINNGKFW